MPPAAEPPRTDAIDVLLLVFACLMGLVLAAKLLDFGRLMTGGGHC